MRYFILLFCIAFGTQSFAQFYPKERGLGPEILYNLPINEWGFGVRGHYHFNDHWIVAPQINYFPGLNQVHELYGGANLMFNINPYNEIGFYVAAGPYVNYWFNYENSPMADAQALNFVVDGAVGITTNYDCVRPFLEYRVNTNWLESHVRAGVVFYFYDCRSEVKCPAYFK